MDVPRTPQRSLSAGCLVGLVLTFAAFAHAEESATIAWIATKSLAAPEAIQAAAADREHFYAIANRSIAKYSRATGQRIAASSGIAEHLNSGFLWDEKLYCAHSNYPQRPEQSEIKTLDLASMQLKTYHDFGDFGGSLTWAVRRDQEWWCNFAFYGDENHKTYLVRLDKAWNETGRWTYPLSLINKLGNYSLSGGVWFGDDLLVTGHDDPVVFRLRLPIQGNELRLVGEESVPFFGQGIAIDPVTSGLVGIQRRTKRLVIAEPFPAKTLPLRVLSYNIHHGEGVDGKLDLERIASIIRSIRPDLVALQEVDQSTQRTGRVDQVIELAKLTEMEAVFGGNISLQGGEYGNAILSRFPIMRHENVQLPRFDQGEQRGVLRCWIDLGPYGDLTFLATHFDHRPKEDERIASAKAINDWWRDWLRQENPSAAILAGDINAGPDSPPVNELEKLWKRTNPNPLATIPVKNPTRQIDYVFTSPSGRWRSIETRVLEEDTASDHRPILAMIELQLPTERKQDAGP